MLLTVNPQKRRTSEELIQRVDMASLLVDIGFADVDPDAEEQVLFCIFHNDSATPSFSVNLAKKVFHCFSPACGIKGSAIMLYALWRRCSYEQAEQEIAYLPRKRSVDALRRALAPKQRQQAMARRLETLTSFSASMPPLTQTPFASYLTSRGLHASTLDWFGLRAFDSGRASTLAADALFQAGTTTVYGHSVFSNHPILFPFWLGNSVVFVQGRAVNSNAPSKYLGTRGTIPSLFGHGALRKGPRSVFLTEGAVDAMSLTQMGYGPAVGIVGAEGFKTEWAEDFKHVGECWIATDHDDAGEAAYDNLRKMLPCPTRRFIFPGCYKDVNAWLNDEKR